MAPTNSSRSQPGADSPVSVYSGTKAKTSPAQQQSTQTVAASSRPFSFSHDFDAVVAGSDIPLFLRENKIAMRFPEQLMFLIVQAEREALQAQRTSQQGCIGWTPDGRAIVIRDKEELMETLLPSVFAKAKFGSFTRKLYRWGFRQVKGEPCCTTKGQSKPDGMVFRHRYFRRDNKPLVANMQNKTANGPRRLTSLAAPTCVDSQAVVGTATLADSTIASSSNREIATLPPHIHNSWSLFSTTQQQDGLVPLQEQNPGGIFLRELTTSAPLRSVLTSMMQPSLVYPPSSYSHVANGPWLSTAATMPFDAKGELERIMLTTLSAIRYNQHP